MTVFPFLPVLDRTYRVRREFLTDVIAHRDGSEQRRALRQSPRKTVGFDTTLKDGRRLEFDRLMVTALRRTFTTPELVRFAVLDGSLAAAGDSVALEAVPDWLGQGDDCFLRAGTDLEEVTVAAIAGVTVTFAQPVAAAWPAGTRLHPALAGRLAPETVTASRYRVVDDIEVVFEVTPGSEPAEPEGSPEATFNGREVFLKQPNIWMPAALTHEQAREPVDAGFGVVETFHPVGFTPRLFEGAFTTLDGAAAEDLRGLFARMKGRLGEFYMPTHRADLPLAQGSGAASSSLRVTGTDVAAIYNGSDLYRAVAAFAGGAWRFNLVTGIAADAGDSVLAVAEPWAVEIPAGATVSWMPVWRLATDALEVSWTLQRVAEAVLAFRMLPALDPDTGEGE